MDEQQNALKVFDEELGEVAQELIVLAGRFLRLQQQASKAQRFGIDEQRDLPTSNRERIEAEWNDLLGSMEVLRKVGIDLSPDFDALVIRRILEKTMDDYHHQNMALSNCYRRAANGKCDEMNTYIATYMIPEIVRKHPEMQYNPPPSIHALMTKLMEQERRKRA